MRSPTFSVAIYCDSLTRSRTKGREHVGPRQLVRHYHYGQRVADQPVPSWWWNNTSASDDLDEVLASNHDSDPAVPDDTTGMVLAPPEQQCPMCGPATWVRPHSPDQLRVSEVSVQEATAIGWAHQDIGASHDPAHPLASHRHLEDFDRAHRPVELRCPERSCGMAVRLPEHTLLEVLDKFRRAGIADLSLGRLAPYADGRVPS